MEARMKTRSFAHHSQLREAAKQTKSPGQPSRFSSWNEFYPSFQKELYPSVLATLAFVIRDPQSPDLSGVGDMGAAIGLGVYAFDLHDAHHLYPLGDEVDLCPGEI